VCQLQISKGLPEPRVDGMAKLSQVLKVIRSLSAGPLKFTRLPITLKILSCIKDNWEAKGLNDDKIMIWVAMMLCFFGFFRSGEICVPLTGLFDNTKHMTFADITVVADNHGSLKHLRI